MFKITLAILLVLFVTIVIIYWMLINRGYTIKFIFTPRQIDKEKLKGLLRGVVHLAKNPPKGRKKLPISYDERGKKDD